MQSVVRTGQSKTSTDQTFYDFLPFARGKIKHTQEQDAEKRM